MRSRTQASTHVTYLVSRLAGVLDSMTVFETVGPGSIPGRVTCQFKHVPFSEVVLLETNSLLLQMIATLEPDG